MVLSRIWTAFIIISIAVATFHWLFNDNEIIFSRMVTGKADDKYPYIMTGGIDGDTSTEVKAPFEGKLKLYGFEKKESVADARYIITDDPGSDTVLALKNLNPDATVYTYKQARAIGMRPVDGIF